MDGYLYLKGRVDCSAAFRKGFFSRIAVTLTDPLFLRTRFRDTFWIAVPASTATKAHHQS